MAFKSLKSSVPKTPSDTSATIFLVIATIFTYIFELIIVIPYVHDIDDTIKYFHIIVGTFILYNVLSNFAMLVMTDTSTSTLILPSILKSGWRFCAVCEANSPPRSHHCHICNKCILKRDHHCVFSGCCIGYRNFRYYYALLIHVSIGGIYSTVLNMFFIWDQLGGFGFTTLLYHLFPFPFWLFGKISFKIMVWTFTSMVNILGFMFAAVLFYYHGNLMIKNQTTHEKNKSIMTYDLGYWKSNIIESLGENWLYAVLLSPTIKSPLPRNGMDFPTKKDHVSNKSK